MAANDPVSREEFEALREELKREREERQRAQEKSNAERSLLTMEEVAHLLRLALSFFSSAPRASGHEKQS
ncbi:hypothetical protein HXX76_002291 [Chlamydomonas incerta]|uniref:Uncharacterized protein n=1 Tax=Chlamydomonas incerta TaxID=51695 RepID=A0A835WAV5_CHLIN|nr:hypothetical protein HXX76_002291 [Chlamydomonas incerta]|eukprot:KAG2443952.1 hypothetical protein HXX76_002291 [Chlamydomonas incerta]